jgi:phenylpyruvate tautomerase PptA (4-oxalocrotonate tautomerase family)
VPILDVEVVGPVGGRTRRGLAARLADAAGRVLSAPPGQTWVRLRFLRRVDYAESAGGPPPGVQPVFVSVLRRTRPSRAALSKEVKAMTLAVARATGRPPENVHVIYRPPAGGRAAFGGSLLDG